MFTGIIERTIHVLAIDDCPSLRRLTVANHWTDVKHGESIAINGVCLTVADLAADRIAFDLIQETLDKTNLGLLEQNDAVNVERSLRVGDRIDGHFVQGHVDGTGVLLRQIANGDEWRLTIEAPESIAKYLVPKGSISVDGVSLTIASLAKNVFDVALIPTTLQLTTLGSRPIGARLNLEADTMAKTIVHFLEQRQTL